MKQVVQEKQHNEEELAMVVLRVGAWFSFVSLVIWGAGYIVGQQYMYWPPFSIVAVTFGGWGIITGAAIASLGILTHSFKQIKRKGTA